MNSPPLRPVLDTETTTGSPSEVLGSRSANTSAETHTEILQDNKARTCLSLRWRPKHGIHVKHALNLYSHPLRLHSRRKYRRSYDDSVVLHASSPSAECCFKARHFQTLDNNNNSETLHIVASKYHLSIVLKCISKKRIKYKEQE